MPVPRTEVLITVAGSATGRFVLVPGDYVIGRNDDCPIRVDADLVSRQHAKLILNYDHAFIEDLGSSNGTNVNGQPVKGRTRLWPNQKIQIGAATIELRRLQGDQPTDMSLAPAQMAIRRMLPAEMLREKKYDIGAVVARGGMGAILDAREAAIERKVAMKVMLDTNDADDISRFVAEAKVTGQLEHPNIVPVHELGVDENGQPFYTMKMVKGITLKKVLDLMAAGTAATVAKYPLAALLTIFQKVCDALAFAHSRGVIHRDLKPENLMIGDFGEVLVMDWGLAKQTRSAEGGARKEEADAAAERSGLPVPTSALGSTLAGTIMGTPQFMAPEQARGEIERIDARSDIYSLGAILYQILALRISVTGADAMEVVGKVGRGEIEPLVERVAPSRVSSPMTTPQGRTPQSARGATRSTSHLPGGRIPDSLAAVVRKAMSLGRTGRYQSVADLQRDIEAYQCGFATGAENAGKWKRFTLFVRRNKAASIGVAAVLVLSVAFTARVIGERNRAERTLGELRGTAPTFEAQSRALLAEGKLHDALAKLGYAVQLAPENADYRLARAHLLQSTQQLPEATGEYRRVLVMRPGDAAAKANLDLLETIREDRGTRAELPVYLQSRLLDALIAQQRDLEAAPLAKLLSRDTETAGATIRARLAAYTTQKGWTANRIRREGKGFFVDLGALQLGDLNALRGLTIVNLNLNQTSVTDLRPLIGLPLETLGVVGTHVSDLSPLRGMKLRTLSISGTEVSDLSPLAGMPLKDLDISVNRKLTNIKPLAGLPLEKLNAAHLPITDISALRGMPLIEVTLTSVYTKAAIQDYSPLAHSPTLEKICLNPEIADIAFLATLPKLKLVEYHHDGGNVSRWIPARDFIAMYGPDVPEIKAARAALATAGLKDLPIWRVAVDPDHQLRLDLNSKPLTDLATLRGLPIKQLNVGATGVSDLEPLRGMHIQDLNINQTKVRDLDPLRGMPIRNLNFCNLPLRDIEPLRGMPIKNLNLCNTGNVTNLEPLRGMPLVKLELAGSGARDLSVLVDCPDLEEIRLPPNATNVERLRSLLKLRYLSTRMDANNRPAQTTAEFWKEYDAQQAAGKK